MFLASVVRRLHQNYFMADRLEEYRDLLLGIRGRGYRFVTIGEFAQAIRRDRKFHDPVCLLRVDVDSDPRGARRMFEAERALGIRATYYFRLSTIDRVLIAEMARHGAEIGYHFEELSALARRRGLRDIGEVERARDELRQQFRDNLQRFRERAGIDPRTVAAHGDFLNRRLHVPNNRFVDRALLEETGIVAEAYEPWLVSQVSARIADRPRPQNWHPNPPDEVLERRPAAVSLIVHPRQWMRNPWANARVDVERFWGGAEYRFNRLRRRFGAAA